MSVSRWPLALVWLYVGCSPGPVCCWWAHVPCFGCSAREFKVGACGLRCVHAVGEVKLEMTSFVVPRGRIKRWWSSIEERFRFNFKVLQTLMNFTLSSLLTPWLFFCKDFFKRVGNCLCKADSSWNLAANYFSLCICLLGFLSTSKEENMLTIVQPKIL